MVYSETPERCKDKGHNSVLIHLKEYMKNIVMQLNFVWSLFLG